VRIIFGIRAATERIWRSSFQAVEAVSAPVLRVPGLPGPARRTFPARLTYVCDVLELAVFAACRRPVELFGGRRGPASMEQQAERGGQSFLHSLL